MTDTDGAQFKTEGEPAFPVADTENDNSADSPSDKTGTDQSGASDQNKKGTENKGGSEDNLADHPRWKEREEDWKERFNEQETRHTAEINKLREEFTGKGDEKKRDDLPEDVPAWFGGDESAWRSFKTWNDANMKLTAEQARTQALTEIQNKSAEDQKRIEDATKYFTDEVGNIESDKTLNPDGTKLDRNKLLKFTMDNDLVDSKGRWNYRAAYQLMRANVKQVSARETGDRKQFAGATTDDKHSESKTSTAMTSEDFANPSNRPW